MPAKRCGTEAAGLPGQIPPEIKKERMARLLAAAEAGEVAFRQALLGSRATVLWERPRGGMGHGLTDNYLRVFSEAAAGLSRQLTAVDLVALTAGGVVGTIPAV